MDRPARQWRRAGAACGVQLMAWLWLLIGGVFEVGFTTSLRFVAGIRKLGRTLDFLVSVTLSMGLLEFASRTIPLGTAFAVWCGFGAAGTVIVGICFFGVCLGAILLLLL